jgi:hypothetical protein
MANEYWNPSEGRFGTNWNSIAGEQTVLLRSNSSDRLLSDPVPITNLPFSSIEGRRAETVDETNAEPIVRVDDFM